MIGTNKIMVKISFLERNIHGKWFVYRFVIQAKKLGNWTKTKKPVYEFTLSNAEIKEKKNYISKNFFGSIY